MTTKLISLNEFRKNLTKIWKEAVEKDIKYIVMVHSKPVLEVYPVGKKDLAKSLKDAIDEAWNHAKVKKGRDIILEYSKKGRKQMTKYGKEGKKTIVKYSKLGKKRLTEYQDNLKK